MLLNKRTHTGPALSRVGDTTDGAEGKVWRSRGARRRRFDPRIEHRRARLLIVAHTAEHDGEAVMERRCGDDQIALREGMAGFAAVFDRRAACVHPPLPSRGG